MSAAQIDLIAAPPQRAEVGRWKTNTGQRWRIGPHTLVIDDCSNVELPEQGALFFDPPWEDIATAFAPDCWHRLAFCDGFRLADVVQRFGPPAWLFTWDCVSSWYTQGRPLRRAKYCLWYGDLSRYRFDGSHYGGPREQKKRTVQNSRGSYEFTPDARGKHLSDVFVQPITRLHSTAQPEHRHSKPVDWIRMLIANCLPEDRVVIDPYAGSGVAMLACDQLGRPCFSVERDPEIAAGILDLMSIRGYQPEEVSDVQSP